MKTHATRAAATLITALLIAGCGQVIDNDEAEVRISKTLTKGMGVPISAARCPQDVKVEPGTSFRCAFTAARSRLKATLKIVNERGDLVIVSVSKGK